MEPIFLTPGEVAELTGAKVKAGQIRVLKANGIRHTIKHSGWPCVTRSAVMDAKPSTKGEILAWTPRKAG